MEVVIQTSMEHLQADETSGQIVGCTAHNIVLMFLFCCCCALSFHADVDSTHCRLSRVAQCLSTAAHLRFIDVCLFCPQPWPSTGSIIRDIACNKNDICVVGMSWDGVVVSALSPARFGDLRRRMCDWACVDSVIVFERLLAQLQQCLPVVGRIGVERCVVQRGHVMTTLAFILDQARSRLGLESQERRRCNSRLYGRSSFRKAGRRARRHRGLWCLCLRWSRFVSQLTVRVRR